MKIVSRTLLPAMRFLCLAFLLDLSVAITSNPAAKYSVSSALRAGESNSFFFSFAGNLRYGEYIGVFARQSSAGVPFTCNTAGQYPIVEVLPSALLTHATSNLASLTSPQRTSSFGALPHGMYVLCYCNLISSNSNRCDYQASNTPVGTLFSSDTVLNQNLAVSSTGTSFLTYHFHAASGFSNGVLANPHATNSERIMVIPSNGQCGITQIQNEFKYSGVNSGSDVLYSSADISSNIKVSADKTTFRQAVTPAGNQVLPGGEYKVCMCMLLDYPSVFNGAGTAAAGHMSATGIQTPGSRACPPFGSTSYSTDASMFNIEVGNLFVHDLTFSHSSSVLVVPPSSSSKVPVSFKYSSPAVLVGGKSTNKFWFAAANVSCGEPSTANSADRTSAYQFPVSQAAGPSVDFSSLLPASHLYRMCYYSVDATGKSSIHDLSNVGVRVVDVTATPLAPVQPMVSTSVPVHFSWSSSLTHGAKVWFADTTSRCSSNPAFPLTSMTIPTSGVNVATDSITFANHGLVKGSKVKYLQKGGAALAGLTDNSEYFVDPVDSSTFKVFASMTTLSAGTNIDLTGTGNSAQEFVASAAASSSNFQTLTHPGIYWFDLSGLPASTTRKTLRLCVAPAGENVAELASYLDYGLVVQVRDVDVYLPFKSRLTAVEGTGNVVFNTGNVQKAVHFGTANAFPAGSTLWFMRASKPCGEGTLQYSSADSSGSVTVGTHTQSGSAYTYTYTLDFSGIAVPTFDLFRLCVKDSTAKVVYSYPNAAVMVTGVTNSPTPFFTVPTPAPAYSVTSIPLQFFEAPPKGAVGEEKQHLTWKFTGQLMQGDRLGFLPVTDGSDYFYCGEKVLNTGAEFWALASRDGAPTSFSTSETEVVSGELPGAMAAGRYQICYCNSGWNGHAHSVPPRDCSRPENWKQFVGFYTVSDTDINTNTITAPAYKPWKVSLKIGGIISANDRFMLVAPGSKCGEAMPKGNFLPSVAPSTTSFGLSSQVLQLTTTWNFYGQFEICYCRSASEKGGVCPTIDAYGKSVTRWTWAYSSKVGTITVHDLQLVSQKYSSSHPEVQTSRMAVTNSASAQVTFRYNMDFLRPAVVWFARTDNPCVIPTYATPNVTASTLLPASGDAASFNFQVLLQAGCSQFRLCAAKTATNTVFDLSDIRVVVNDVSVPIYSKVYVGSTASTTTNPVTTATSLVDIAGSCSIDFGPATHIWFAQVGTSCTKANPSVAGAANSKYAVTKKTTIAGAFAGPYSLDFSAVTLRRGYRMCASAYGPHSGTTNLATPVMDYSQAQESSWIWDYPETVVYPVKAKVVTSRLDIGGVISNGPALSSASSAVKVELTAAGSSGATLPIVQSDTLWWRRQLNPCGSSPSDAIGGGASTSSPEVTFQGTLGPNVFTTFDFSRLVNAAANYRLCVRTEAGLVLDYTSAVIDYLIPTPTAPYPLTKQPTAAPAVVAAASTAAQFSPTYLTITPGASDPATPKFTWVSKKTNAAGRSIVLGDRISFHRVSSPAASPCGSITSSPAFETGFQFPVAAGFAATINHQLPRMQEGVYYVCFCRAQATCGDGAVAFDSDIGVLSVVDTDIEQTIVVQQGAQASMQIPFNFHPSATNDRIYITAADQPCGTAPYTGATASTFTYTTVAQKASQLVATAGAANDIPTSVGKYSVCYCNHLSVGGTCPTANAGLSLFDKHGMYSKVGNLIVYDLSLTWGNMNPSRCSGCSGDSLSVKTMHSLKMTFTGNLFSSADTYWFMDAERPCSTEQQQAITSSLYRFPTTSGSSVSVHFSGAKAGTRFYRMCIQTDPFVAGSNYRDLSNLGFFITDVVVSPISPVVLKNSETAVRLTINASASLAEGDYFWFQPSSTVCNNAPLSFGQNVGGQYLYGAAVGAQASSVTRFSGTREYPVYFDRSISAFGTWRMCVSHSEFHASTGVTSTTVRDYAGVQIFPRISQWEVSPNPVEASSSSVLTIRTPHAVSASDRFWFRRVGQPCSMALAGAVLTDSTLDSVTASATFSLSATTLPQQVTVGMSRLVPNAKYRLCMSTTNSRLLDFDTIIVDTVPVRAPTHVVVPTPVNVYAPTPVSAVSLESNKFQSFTFNSVASAGSRNQMLWQFQGVVKPSDRIAVMPAQVTQCSAFGRPSAIVYATNTTSAFGSRSSAWSGAVPSMPAGKYLLCYCNADTAASGCSGKGSFTHQMGFVTFFDAEVNQTASVSMFDRDAGFSVTLGHRTNLGDRLVVIDSSSDLPCGVAQPAAGISSALLSSSVTANGNVLTYSGFSKSTVGTYHICYCNSASDPLGCVGSTADPTWLPRFGGKIGTLLVHDIKFNGSNYVNVDPATKRAEVKVTQNVISFGQDQVWLAKASIDCGTGSHTLSQAKTASQLLQPSMVFDFSTNAAFPSPELWRLCVLRKGTGTVSSIDTVGAFFVDVSLSDTQVSPLAAPSQQLTLSHPRSFSPSSTSFFYWRHTSLPCFQVFPLTLSAPTSTDRDTSTMAAVSISNSAYTFDLSVLTKNRAYRLCAGTGYTAASSSSRPRFTSVVDMPNVKIYPHSPLLKLSSEFLLNITDNKLTLPGNSNLQQDDIVWFRRSDMKCQSSPPAASSVDKFSLAAFNFQPEVVIDASHVELSDKPFRMCVSAAAVRANRGAEAPQALDFYSVTVSVVHISTSTNTCNRGSCNVAITWASARAFSGQEQAWFQSTFAGCSLPAGSTTSTSSAKPLIASGYSWNSFDFSNVNQGPRNPLRLCISKGGQISDIHNISLVVTDAALAPLSSVVNAFQTKQVVAEKQAVVNMTYSAYAFPTGSTTWFTKKGTACRAGPASATSSGTYAPSKISSFGAVVSFVYDFSTVDTSGNSVVAFTMCIADTDGTVTSYSTVEIEVYRLSVTPAAVSIARVPVTISPQYLHRGFYFKKEGLSCYPIPSSSFSGGDDHTQVNYFPSSASQYDFSQAAARDVNWRVCAVSLLDPQRVFDFPNAKVLLACPEGFSGPQCDQPAPKRTASPTAVPTAKPTAVPTTKPTAAPTAKPTAAPTATPTPEPTTKPTASAASTTSQCSSSDSATYKASCSSWVAQGFCASDSQYASFMLDNCRQSCCEAGVPGYSGEDKCAKAAADKSSSCNGWGTAGFCASSSEYAGYMAANCARTCCKMTGTVTTASPTPAATGECATKDADQYSSCAYWAKAGYCQDAQYQSFMSKGCARSCCSQAVQETSKCANPVDSKSECSNWGNAGFCAKTSQYYAFMTHNCAKTCCATAATSSTTAECAADKNDSCKAWATAGYCSKESQYYSYMTATCGTSCCSSTTTRLQKGK